MTLLIIAMPVIAVFAAAAIGYAKSASAAHEDEIMNMKLKEARSNLVARNTHRHECSPMPGQAVCPVSALPRTHGSQKLLR